MLVLRDFINTNSNKLSDVLKSLVQFVESLKICTEQNITIDCTSVHSVHPIFSVALNNSIASLNKNIQFINENEDLKRISFSSAIRAEELKEDDLHSILSKNNSCNSTPLISFPASAENAVQKDRIVSLVENFMREQYQIAANVFYGMKYVNGEFICNITEHSQSERGFIMGAFNSKEQYIDLCIADEGISVYNSYRNAKIEVEDDFPENIKQMHIH